MGAKAGVFPTDRIPPVTEADPSQASSTSSLLEQGTPGWWERFGLEQVAGLCGCVLSPVSVCVCVIQLGRPTPLVGRERIAGREKEEKGNRPVHCPPPMEIHTQFEFSCLDVPRVFAPQGTLEARVKTSLASEPLRVTIQAPSPP